MMKNPCLPVEGELYKTITVAGHSFELKYGYYEEYERSFGPPVIIFPNFIQTPRFTTNGYPLVTQIQDPCRHFSLAPGREEFWCGDCRYFVGAHPEIGECRCPYCKLPDEEGKK